MAAAVSTPSGAPPMPITACTPVPATAAAMPADRSPSPISRMRAPGRPDIGDQLFVARAVEHHHGELVHLAAEAARDRAQVLAHRGIEIDQMLRARPDDELLHVDVGRMQQAAALGGGEHGDGVGLAGGAQRFVPSSGSTAMSTSSNCRAVGHWRGCAMPTFSPMYSIGASSRSPSPMTIVPSMGTVSSSLRIASTAA